MNDRAQILPTVTLSYIYYATFYSLIGKTHFFDFNRISLQSRSCLQKFTETAECLDELTFADLQKSRSNLIKKKCIWRSETEIKRELSLSFMTPLPPPPPVIMGSAWSERDNFSLPFNVQRKFTPICTSLFYDVIFSCQREGAESFGAMSEFKFFNDRDGFVQRRLGIFNLAIYKKRCTLKHRCVSALQNH